MKKRSFLNAVLLVFTIFLLSATPGTKFKRISITKGISVKLPQDFMQMSDNDIAQKYPSTKKPLAMYTRMDRMVDFGLNVTKANWAGNNLNVLKEIYKTTLYTLYKEVSISKDEVKIINKNNFVILEFTSLADETRKYTYIQYGVFNNRIYIFNFTCPAQLKDKLQPVAEQIMHSIKVRPRRLERIEYNPAGEKGRKGKNPKEVLEEQRRRQSIKTTQK